MLEEVLEVDEELDAELDEDAEEEEDDEEVEEKEAEDAEEEEAEVDIEAVEEEEEDDEELVGLVGGVLDATKKIPIPAIPTITIMMTATAILPIPCLFVRGLNSFLGVHSGHILFMSTENFSSAGNT